MSPTYTESDDHDDLEVGCTAYSETHSEPRGKIGGVVIAVDYDERSVEVVRVPVNVNEGPRTFTIPFADIDMSVVGFGTRDARITGAQILAWATTPDKERRVGKAKWVNVGITLMEIGEAGSNTPRAEARYRRRFDG